MIKIKLDRTVKHDRVYGHIFPDCSNISLCDTLELPWRENKQNISCIPSGSYECQYNWAKDKIDIFNVVDRSEVQIHVGNKLSEIMGCVLVGQLNPTNTEIEPGTSRPSFEALKSFVGIDKFKLEIFDWTGITNLNVKLEKITIDRRTWKDIGKPMEVLPVPDHEVKVKIPWYMQDGIKRNIGMAITVIGLIVSAFNDDLGKRISEIGSVIIAGGLAHAAVKSSPANDGKAGWFYKFVEFLIEKIKELLKYMKK